MSDRSSMFLTGFIDVEVWERAQWRGVMFLGRGPERPPVLGLYFENAEAGESIFRNWKKYFGDKDERDELRISIIEGDLPGQLAGYSVTIGTTLESALERAKLQGSRLPASSTHSGPAEASEPCGRPVAHGQYG